MVRVRAFRVKETRVELLEVFESDVSKVETDLLHGQGRASIAPACRARCRADEECGHLKITTTAQDLSLDDVYPYVILAARRSLIRLEDNRIGHGLGDTLPVLVSTYFALLKTTVIGSEPVPVATKRRVCPASTLRTPVSATYICCPCAELFPRAKTVANKTAVVITENCLRIIGISPCSFYYRPETKEPRPNCVTLPVAEFL